MRELASPMPHCHMMTSLLPETLRPRVFRNCWPILFRRSSMQDVLAAAQQWMELDPDNAQILADELDAARNAEDWAITELTSRFTDYLTFGTAGLRAPMGPGTARMN